MGCAMQKTVLPSGCTPDGKYGYVAGLFSGSAINLGFGMVNTETKKEIIMPFFSDEERIKREEYTPEQVTMIKVPPGQYKLAYWVIFDGLIPKTRNFPDRQKPKAFTVNPGRVVFIGSYAAVKIPISNFGGRRITKYVISPNRVNLEEFEEKFKGKHPEFYSNNFRSLEAPGLGHDVNQIN